MISSKTTHKPPLFLVVVIFGFLITMVCFGPHEPARTTLEYVLEQFRSGT